MLMRNLPKAEKANYDDGQIREPGQADKLTYVSLIHQIDSAIEKGFTEKEIADAIIKSISPHSSLRNYILTLPDRSLAFSFFMSFSFY